MNVYPTTPSEIINIATQMKTSHSCGLDEIDPILVSASFLYISQVLSDLINYSLSSGIFPEQLKFAKVIPIHKSDNTHVISNYRPISILNYFSKFIDKIMHTRLYKYLSKFSMISDDQFGFRKGHSTSAGADRWYIFTQKLLNQSIKINFPSAYSWTWRKRSTLSITPFS